MPVKQILGDGCLNDIPARTGVQSLPHHLRRIVLTKNQDVGRRKKAADFAGGFEAIESSAY